MGRKAISLSNATKAYSIQLSTHKGKPGNAAFGAPAYGAQVLMSTS